MGKLEKTIYGFIKKCVKCGDFYLSQYGFGRYCDFCRPPKKYRTITYRFQKLRKEVLKRDKYICKYCGGKANSVDHIYPYSKGGPDTLENLTACCRPCNTRKLDKIIIDLKEVI